MQRNPKNNVANRLTAEAFDALDRDDFKRAIKLGRQLKKLRFSSAFEILALAYAADDKLDKAIAVLEEGVIKAPSVWLLWQLLGNYYSDRGRYAKSRKCYRQALDCPQVDADSVHLNASIALGREEKYPEALAEVSLVTGKKLRPHAISQTMHLLNMAKKYGECVTIAKKAIAIFDREKEENQPLDEIHAQTAYALWKSRRKRDLVLKHAWRSIKYNNHNETAAWVIRKVANRKSSSAHHMTIMVRGRLPRPLGKNIKDRGFYINYEVVADTPEEAIALIRPFEPEEVRETLAIEECKVKEAVPDMPKGVCGNTGVYILFPWEKELSKSSKVRRSKPHSQRSANRMTNKD